MPWHYPYQMSIFLTSTGKIISPYIMAVKVLSGEPNNTMFYEGKHVSSQTLLIVDCSQCFWYCWQVRNGPIRYIFQDFRRTICQHVQISATKIIEIAWFEIYEAYVSQYFSNKIILLCFHYLVTFINLLSDKTALQLQLEFDLIHIIPLFGDCQRADGSTDREI